MKNLLLLLIPLFIFSCGYNDAGVRYATAGDVQIKTDQNGFTSEQRNILARQKIALDPNQIMWIYCMADNGQVIFYSAVKGKITSSNKKLITVNADVNDGTGGESDNYVYFFDPSGKYFQWNGKYFLSTFEIQIASPVLNTRSVK